MGIYYDQIFTYIGWGVLSGLSLFAVVVSVFGMDRIFVEQKKAEQYQVQAEEKGIEWECDVRIPKQCDINEFDLCVLLGNLLDNALEACERLQRKGKEKEQGEQLFICVGAQAVKSCILLEVKNSMDAEETRKIAEKQREEMIENRREEREEQQKKLEEKREENKADKIVDTVEISEDGKVLLKENTANESGAADGAETDGINPDDGTKGKPKADLEPVFYSSAGTVEQAEDTGVKVSASI